MVITHYIHTLWAILKTDFYLFKQTIITKIIDICVWISSMVIIYTYLLPSFGLETSYTAFLVASLVASAGIFEVYASATNLISDLESTNITSFYLTLPIPSWLVFVRSIIFYTCNSASLAILVLPIYKIMIWSRIPLEQVQWGKFALILMLSNMLYATLTLVAASYVSRLARIRSMWMRLIYPLWMFGGFQFSYAVLKSINPFWAGVLLLNPMVYVMEGTRHAILGQPTLNFWICVLMLPLFSCLFAWHGIARFKRRLDFI